jgi:transcription elongation factor GreA
MSTMTAARKDYEVALTRGGYQRLRDDLAALTMTGRAEIRDRLRDAREQGGELVDNLELIDALEDQEMLERRIATLEASLASALVVDEPPHDGTIGIGTRVRLRDIENGRTAEYDVVGSIEADPVHHRLSADSPVGRALLGRRAGDVLQVEAPRGNMRFRILAARSGGQSAGRPSARSRGARRAGGLSRVGRGALAAAR